MLHCLQFKFYESINLLLSHRVRWFPVFELIPDIMYNVLLNAAAVMYVQ